MRIYIKAALTVISVIPTILKKEWRSAITFLKKEEEMACLNKQLNEQNLKIEQIKKIQ